MGFERPVIFQAKFHEAIAVGAYADGFLQMRNAKVSRHREGLLVFLKPEAIWVE